MAFIDIRAEDVLEAMKVMDDPAEGPKLIKQLHFGPARRYRVVHQGRFYDSKPLVGIAHGLRTGEYLASDKFSGGYKSLGWLSTRLGFHIDDQAWLYKISQLRVDRTHGKPAPYQYVVLLWAIARCLHSDDLLGDRRLVAFSDVRDELSELLEPFAIAATRPDPFMPWIALARTDELWDSSARSSSLWGSGQSLDAIVRSDPEAQFGGLASPFYSHIQYERHWYADSFVHSALYYFESLLGTEPGYFPLLERLGLLGQEPAGESDASPEVADAEAAIDELSNPRRKRSARHFNAAENKAIEERAVAAVREHLESEGYETQDVGLSQSYDVHAVRGDDVLKVEVKGTTTDGSQVVLTRNEVNLHRTEYPNTALFVVRHINLDRAGQQPIATGGELVKLMPFDLDESGLTPLAYEYRTGI